MSVIITFLKFWFLWLPIVFLGAGIWVIKTYKLKKRLRKFFILTLASLFLFVLFVVLHNLFYALTQLTQHIVFLSYLFEFIHIIFFLVSVFVCPIGFLVGVIGSLVVYFQEKK